MEDSDLGCTLEEWMVLHREEKEGTPPGGRNHGKETLRGGSKDD